MNTMKYKIGWTLSSLEWSDIIARAREDEDWDGDEERLILEMEESLNDFEDWYLAILEAFGDNVEWNGHNIDGSLVGSLEVTEGGLKTIQKSDWHYEIEGGVEYTFSILDIADYLREMDVEVDKLFASFHYYDDPLLTFSVYNNN